VGNRAAFSLLPPASCSLQSTAYSLFLRLLLPNVALKAGALPAVSRRGNRRPYRDLILVPDAGGGARALREPTRKWVGHPLGGYCRPGVSGGLVLDRWVGPSDLEHHELTDYGFRRFNTTFCVRCGWSWQSTVTLSAA